MSDKKDIQLTILGSGTCVPSLARRPCSILLKINHHRILVDAGPGIMGQMLKAGVQINELDMILLSHFHLDHCAEIPPLIFALKYSGFKQEKHLSLVGGDGLIKFMHRLNLAYHQFLELPESAFSLHELGDHGMIENQVNTSACAITYAKVNHRPESRAYRFEDSTGYSLVYSGDTDESDALVELADKADVLICEASWPDDQKVPGHLTPALAGEIASSAKVKTLVMTHFYPECLISDIESQCRKKFDGDIVLAQDLLEI